MSDISQVASDMLSGDTTPRPGFNIADVPGFADAVQRWREANGSGVNIDPTPTEIDGNTFVRQPATEGMQGNNASRVLVQEMLNRYGLGGLVDVVMGFWTDEMNEAQIMQRLRDHPDFIARFPAISAREAAGLSAVSPEEILQYEDTVRDIFNRAGFPSTFYDTPQEIQELMVNDFSPTEVQERVFEAFVEINRNPDLLETFGNYFADGDQTSAALASWVLDPSRAVPAIERAVAATKFGGTGAGFGFDLSRDTSLGAADRLGSVSDSALRSGFADAAVRRGLASATLGEAGTQSQITETDLVEGTFELDMDAARDIRRRMQGRLGRSAGGGGFSESRRGVIGLR